MTRLYTVGLRYCSRCECASMDIFCTKCGYRTRYRPRGLPAKVKERLYRGKRY